MGRTYLGDEKVLRDFNLLATTSRGNEGDACSELSFLLKEIGDPSSTVEKTGITGLIAARTERDPVDAIGSLRMVLAERPYEFRYVLRAIPVEIVVRTDLAEIGRVAANLGKRIGKNESFRVTIEKRFSNIPSRDLIEAAATEIDRRVDLLGFDKVLLLEVVGGFTGMSLIGQDDILSVVKEKML